jgi:hypothetical protein
MPPLQRQPYHVHRGVGCAPPSRPLDALAENIRKAHARSLNTPVGLSGASGPRLAHTFHNLLFVTAHELLLIVRSFQGNRRDARGIYMEHNLWQSHAGKCWRARLLALEEPCALLCSDYLLLPAQVWLDYQHQLHP